MVRVSLGRRAQFASVVAAAMLAVAASGPAGGAAAATTYTIFAGAAGADQAAQIYDFIPKPVTVSVGDTVTWHVGSGEFHTVTFLGDQPNPGFVSVGPQGPQITPLAAFPTGGTSVPSAGPVSSGLLNEGQDFSLTFTQPGTYDYVCLVHPHMAGQIVVVPTGQPVPTRAEVAAEVAPHVDNDLATAALPLALGAATEQAVDTGTGETAAGVTAGTGDTRVALDRFLPGNVTVHAGELVTWTNADPDTPHTVTFTAGQPAPDVIMPEPQPNGPPALLLNPAVLAPAGGTDFDGSTYTNSGFIGGPPYAQTATYSLRFTKPGTYQYVCLLHDDLGMKGTVTVLPAAAGQSAPVQLPGE